MPPSARQAADASSGGRIAVLLLGGPCQSTKGEVWIRGRFFADRQKLRCSCGVPENKKSKALLQKIHCIKLGEFSFL